MLRVVLGERVWVPQAALEWSYSRAGGPGGQHVNTTSSRVQLKVQVGALVGMNARAQQRLRDMAGHRLVEDDYVLLVCAQDRSQSRNRALILDRLRALIAQALPEPKKRIATKPTKGAQRRRLETKKLHGLRKQRRRERFD